MVGYRGAREATQEQGARDQKDAEVSQALEECCHHVTPPTNAVDGFRGRQALNICPWRAFGGLCS
jgi:hypothetical protein